MGEVSDLPNRRRRTLRRAVKTKGIGLHSGKPVQLSLIPSRNDGRICRRTDLDGAEIPLSLSSVVPSQWATLLSVNGVTVSTVEHLLAALYALEIDDVLVEVDGEEFPALDGSAARYLDLVESAGSVDTDEEIAPVRVTEPFWISGEEKHIIAFPSDRLKVTYAVDYHHAVIGKQFISLDIAGESFREELAPARTFALEEWIEGLREKGLAAGGSLENAIVVHPDRYSTELRFENEMVRHKALDLVGDLALIGRPVCAHVMAVCCSHAMHLAMARRILDANVPVAY